MLSTYLKLSVIIGILLGLFSCAGIDDMTRYSIGFDSEVLIIAPIRTLDSAVGGDSINEFMSEFEVPAYDQKLEDHGDTRDKVEKVRMSEFRFRVKDESTNLDFIQDIDFFIESNSGKELKIGQATDVSTTFTNLDVGIVFDWEEDMRDFLENGYRIRITFTADQQIPEDLKFNCGSVFQVDTKKFGI